MVFDSIKQWIAHLFAWVDSEWNLDQPSASLATETLSADSHFETEFVEWIEEWSVTRINTGQLYF